MAACPPFFVFANPDKEAGPEDEGADPLMPKWPFRLAVVGPPGCGKRCAALNIVTRLDPWPERILLLHLDSETSEWDELAPEKFAPDEPPSFEDLERGGRTLLIVDEVDLGLLDRKNAGTVERLFGYGSTHRGTSIVLCYQTFHRIPPAVRRACSHVILFRSVDAAERSAIAVRVGCPREELAELFGLLRSHHDSVMIALDEPPESPKRYRLNLWTPILRRR